jgi:hypothetical protein
MVDYDPISSLADLAQASTAVVHGRIERVQEGRTSATVGHPDGQYSYVSSVLVVTGVTIVSGALEPGADGKVYLEFAPRDDVVDGDPAGECDAVLPEGTVIVAYLRPAWNGAPAVGGEAASSDVGMAAVDPQGGRPAGQALYTAAALEGLAWQIPGSDDVIWPLYLGVGAGDIRNTLPGGSLAGPRP